MKPGCQAHRVPQQVATPIQFIERVAGVFNQGLVLLPTLTTFFQLMLFQSIRASCQLGHGTAAEVEFFDRRTVSDAAPAKAVSSEIQGHDSAEDEADERVQSSSHHQPAQPDAARLVRVFSTLPAIHLSNRGQVDSHASAKHFA